MVLINGYHREAELVGGFVSHLGELGRQRGNLGSSFF